MIPVWLDDAVMETTDQLAHGIKRMRSISDFSEWKEYYVLISDCIRACSA